MSTSSSIWVVISCEDVTDKIREYIDSGSFAEANSLNYQVNSFNEKIKALIAERGGSILICIPDRTVLECALTIAEDLPNILEGYKQFFGTKICVGIGMTFTEASAALRKSRYTNNIEMYDPHDDSFKAGSPFYKHEDLEYYLPPNLFDPKEPNRNDEKAKLNPKLPYKPGPTLDEEMQGSADMVQAVMQQMGAQSPDQTSEDEQQPEPRDLLEALHGESIPGREQQMNENAGGAPEAQPDEDDEGGDDDKDKSKSKSKSSDSKESKSSDDDDEEDHNDKLGKLMSTVQEKIPQLMSLAEHNPEVYKQTLNMIQKLLAVVKDRKKSDTSKAEIEDLTEQLNKAISLRLPVGTVKGRKKKVMIDGHQVWRSMASGQVKDPKGSAISVKSHNAQQAVQTPNPQQTRSK